MRWNYDSPEEQVLVSDGTTFSMYFSNLQQMIVSPAEAIEEDMTYSFFTGSGKLSEDFSILGPNKNVVEEGEDKDLRIIQLVPKSAESQVQDIHLWVTADSLIQRIEIRDQFDTRTILTLSDIRENFFDTADEEAAAKLFTFKPPEGTEIIQRVKMPDAESPHTCFRATLISMPWALFNRPSLQLAALKAYVEREMDGGNYDPATPSFIWPPRIGSTSTGGFRETSWAGEALFAPLVFPGAGYRRARSFRESLRQSRRGREPPDFDEPRRRDRRDLPRLVGRPGFFRLPAGRFFRLLRPAAVVTLSRRPDRRNGAAGPRSSSAARPVAGRIGRSLLRHFPQIDYVIDGEGERPLLGFCAFLGGKSDSLPEQVSGRTLIPAVSCPQIEDLNLLPIPDFHPVFCPRWRHCSPPCPSSPSCRWNFPGAAGGTAAPSAISISSGRATGYKTAERMTAEVETLVRGISALISPSPTMPCRRPRPTCSLARRGESAEDCRFFAEIRGTTRPEQLEIYSRGGLQTIQVGIEALSTSLLRKMVKGVTAIDNIAMMKFSLACGIRLEGNLILEFPGSTLEEVGETLENLDFVLPYRPLATAVFFLGHGSPVHRESRRLRDQRRQAA